MFATHYLGLLRLKRLLIVLGCIPCKTALATPVLPPPQVLPDVMVGLKLTVPLSKAPARVGVEFRGGPYLHMPLGYYLFRAGGSTFVDGGKDGVRFGLTAYGGAGWGDGYAPIIAVDFDAGFVVGSPAVPQGWLVSAQMEGGRRLRGSFSYEVVKPFHKTENEAAKYLSFTLGAFPMKWSSPY